MSPVLVIGSNSFSGASFVAHALAQGQPVLGISRSAEPDPVFLPYRWGDASGFEFHAIDLNHDLDRLQTLLQRHRPRQVVNFAAQSMVAESWQHPEHWFMTNTVATVRLHDVLRHCDFLERYLHISTPEVYGHCSGDVREDQPFNPSTPYAVSRAAADMSLRTYFAAHGFPVLTTRAANVYGPGQQLYRIIPRTILRILTGQVLQLHGGGHSSRSFIHIDDVSRATWAVLQHGEPGVTYHVATREQITIRELVARLCARLGVRFEDHVQDVGERLGKDAAYRLDSSRLRRELGWQDQIDLDRGLDGCIAWVRRHLDRLRQLPQDYQHKP